MGQVKAKAAGGEGDLEPPKKRGWKPRQRPNNETAHEHIDQVKDMECEQCPFKASAKLTLRQHKMSVHKQERNFECDKCTYAAARKYTLNKHIKSIHDMKKYFVCGHCDFSSHTRRELKDHIKSAHDKIRDLACDICGYRTSLKSCLKKHIKRRHSIFKQNIKYASCANLQRLLRTL